MVHSCHTTFRLVNAGMRYPINHRRADWFLLQHGTLHVTARGGGPHEHGARCGCEDTAEERRERKLGDQTWTPSRRLIAHRPRPRSTDADDAMTHTAPRYRLELVPILAHGNTTFRVAVTGCDHCSPQYRHRSQRVWPNSPSKATLVDCVREHAGQRTCMVMLRPLLTLDRAPAPEHPDTRTPAGVHSPIDPGAHG